MYFVALTNFSKDAAERIWRRQPKGESNEKSKSHAAGYLPIADAGAQPVNACSGD
jgi:hypothetical protein